MKRNVRLLIVDDHPIVRQTLRSILQPYRDIEVVGEASDGYEAFALVGMVQATVVVMDINMGKMDGITAARWIKKQFPHVLVLGFSADANDHSVYAMRQAGAFEVLEKEDIIKNLYATIRRGLAASHLNPN